VFRIGGAAAVAGEEQLPALRQRPSDALGDVGDGAAKHFILDRRLQRLARGDEIIDDRFHSPPPARFRR
jgi:hypothetical protein